MKEKRRTIKRTWVRSRKAEEDFRELLDRGEEHVPSIENWNGQEVEDPKLADKDDEPKELFESNFGEDTQVIDDADGTAHVPSLAWILG